MRLLLFFSDLVVDFHEKLVIEINVRPHEFPFVFFIDVLENKLI